MRFFITIVLLSQSVFYLNAQAADSVYFTTGFKIGDITNSSAIILTRLCKTPKPVGVYHQRKETVFRHPIDFNNNMPIHEMDGAVQGSSGQVKIELITEDTLIRSDWKYVSSYKDFTSKRKFEGLKSNTNYSIIIHGRKSAKSPITQIKGKFKTAPSDNEIAPVFLPLQLANITGHLTIVNVDLKFTIACESLVHYFIVKQETMFTMINQGQWLKMLRLPDINGTL